MIDDKHPNNLQIKIFSLSIRQTLPLFLWIEADYKLTNLAGEKILQSDISKLHNSAAVDKEGSEKYVKMVDKISSANRFVRL